MQLSKTDKDFFHSAAEIMQKICEPLFQNTSLNYFDYQHHYHDGTYLSMSTHPEYTIAYINKDLYPTLYELSKQNSLSKTVKNSLSEQYVFMSEAMVLPQGASEANPSKYLTNILVSKEFEIQHRIYFVKPEENYYRICGFGTANNSNGIFEFYLNSIDFLERFITYFEFQAVDLIQSAKNSMVHLSKFLTEPAGHANAANNLSFAQLKFFPEQYLLKINPDITARLTHHEMECLVLKMRGYTSKEAGRYLKISHRTFEKILPNIKDKTKTISKIQLINSLENQGIFKLFQNHW